MGKAICIHVSISVADCVPGCSDCRQSWNGDSSICKSCEIKGSVASDSECLDHCKPGQYLEARVCKGELDLGFNPYVINGHSYPYFCESPK